MKTSNSATRLSQEILYEDYEEDVYVALNAGYLISAGSVSSTIRNSRLLISAQLIHIETVSAEDSARISGWYLDWATANDGLTYPYVMKLVCTVYQSSSNNTAIFGTFNAVARLFYIEI